MTKQAVHKRFAGPLAERLAAAAATAGQPAFERFTARARSVLMAAAQAATSAAAPEIGTGHLLLVLYAEPDGIAARVLAGLQVSRDQVAAALQQPGAQAGGLPEAGPAGRGRPPMSEAGKAALTSALTVALELGHNYIGTEHILLGLYRDPGSPAARVLAALGGTQSQAEVRVAELLRGCTRP